MPQMRSDQLYQHLAHQARFAGTRHSGNGGKRSQRKVDVNVVEIIACDTGQSQPALGRARYPVMSGLVSEEIEPRLRFFDVFEPGGNTAVEHASAMFARG